MGQKPLRLEFPEEPLQDAVGEPDAAVVPPSEELQVLGRKAGQPRLVERQEGAAVGADAPFGRAEEGALRFGGIIGGVDLVGVEKGEDGRPVPGERPDQSQQFARAALHPGGAVAVIVEPPVVAEDAGHVPSVGHRQSPI